MPQLPSWTSLLDKMLDQGVDELAPGILSKQDQIRKLIKKNQLAAADFLRTGLGPRGFCDFLAEQFRGVRGDERHQIATRLPFAAILTTNFDTLIEDALPPKTIPVLNQTRIPELLRALFKREFCIVHLHGEADESRSIVLAAADYEGIKKDKQFRHYFQTLAATNTFLFVGYSLQDSDLLLFLSQLFRTTAANTGPHFALMHESMVDAPAREGSANATAFDYWQIHRLGIPISGSFCSILKRHGSCLPINPRTQCSSSKSGAVLL